MRKNTNNELEKKNLERNETKNNNNNNDKNNNDNNNKNNDNNNDDNNNNNDNDRPQLGCVRVCLYTNNRRAKDFMVYLKRERERE